MIVLYLGVIIIFFILFLISGRNTSGQNASGGKVNSRHGQKEKNIFNRMAFCIYMFLLEKNVLRRDKVKNKLEMLHPEMEGKKENGEIYLRQFYIRKISLVLFILFAGNLLCICLFIGSRQEGKLGEGKYLERNTYGLGSEEAQLQAEIIRGEKESRQDFTIMIEEQKYEKTLVKELAAEAAEILPEVILGSNPSLEAVRNNLNLVKELEEYPFSIEWESNNYAYIYSDGSVTNETMGEEGEVINLTAIFVYDGYREEHIYPVHILPPEYSEEELIKIKIYEVLAGLNEKNRYEKKLVLPEKVGEARLVWSEKREDTGKYIFLLLCSAAVLIYFFQDKELQEKAELRGRQLLLDYPQLVSRLTLYMGAGMTIRNAFRKIALDYREEKKAGGKSRYVYEEMLLTCYELDSGISETEAYERFGRRCRLVPYMKLGNLLSQNLKKGSNSLFTALKQEAAYALEERKNTAKRMGEEAGTKLLFPMMIMLGIVMMLIIIPAYFSFSV